MSTPPRALASQPAISAAGLNLPPHQLPSHCEVLVVGAGPAGSAAAHWLARAGIDVVLIDRSEFPRDKVCGDGLIPDAHRALHRLGVLDRVLSEAQTATHVAAIGPRGGRIEVPGTLAVLPRSRLDLIVCQAAVAAGARMFAPVRYVEPLLAPLADEDPKRPTRVIGARVRSDGIERDIRADWTILASGALPQALQAAGLCQRHTPSAVAMRGYLHNPSMAERITALEVAWHPRLRTGYGWVFPCGHGLFNIGVGVEHSHRHRVAAGRSMSEIDLRGMLRTFGEIHPTVGELIAGGQWVGALKGAPLRCSLAGSGLSRRGLLVAGEAAGSTFAFTGEGIGKALETGILAAQALIDGRRHVGQAPADDAVLCAGYEREVRALLPLFEVYNRANVVNHHPWLVDLLIWSARRSPARLKKMAGVLDETYMPTNLLRPGSLLRLLFERG